MELRIHCIVLNQSRTDTAVQTNEIRDSFIHALGAPTMRIAVLNPASSMC